MYIYIIGAGFLFFSAAYLFLSKKVSPIPYFPSNKKDIPLIIKALKLKNSQTVVDLGAGGGIVIFEAASYAFKQKLSTKFVAVELNPILVLILQLRRLFHLNRKNIQISYTDMFGSENKGSARVDFLRLWTSGTRGGSNGVKKSTSSDLTIYLYISPWFMEKVFRHLKKKYKHFTLVSYFYSLPKPFKKPVQSYQGVHSIFIYHQASS